MPDGRMLSAAPAWSLWLGEAGSLFVYLAIVAAALTVFCWARAPRCPKSEAWGKRMFPLAGACLLAAYGAILALFVTGQFQYRYVFNHSAADHELMYRIAGVWAGQEGSFLLWAVTSAGFGIVAARYTGVYRRWFTIVFACFLMALAGILAYESPFYLRDAVNGMIVLPETGRGMSAQLLNYWMVIHPPTIFLGFGSLTVLFCWSMAALVQRNLTEWINPVRPWALLSLTFLGLGLCMGGFWAYETLGWGGFWMWDPVENVSFVPWCVLAAFVHGAFVQVARNKWHYGNALLAALPFLLFCYGTFLTRSGFLGEVSVHSFAQMDRTALWILVGLTVVAAGSYLAVWTNRLTEARRQAAPAPTADRFLTPRMGTALGAWTVGLVVMTATLFGVGPWVMALTGDGLKANEAVGQGALGIGALVAVFALQLGLTVWLLRSPTGDGRPLGERVFQREGFYGAAIWLLTAFGAVTAIGMSVPLVQAIAGQAPKIVEEALYHQVLAWFFPPLMLAITVGPFLGWRGVSVGAVIGRLLNVLAVSIFLLGMVLLWLRTDDYGIPPVAGARIDLPFGHQVAQMPWMLFLTWLCLFAVSANVWRMAELWRAARPSLGGLLTHVGVVVTLLGLVFSRGFEQKETVLVHGSRPVEAFGYTVRLIGPTGDFANRHNRVELNVTGKGEAFTASPGLYFVPGAGGEPSPIIWPHVEIKPLYDLYFTLHPMVFEATEPTVMQVGEQRQFDGMLLTYNGPVVAGKMDSTVGAEVAADVTVQVDGQRVDARPMVRVREGEVEQVPVFISEKYVLLLSKMDPQTRAATLEFHYRTAAFPMEVFYKPLTILVWFGVGIMTLGGFLAANYRRRTVRAMRRAARDEAERDQEPTLETAPSVEEEHASEPVA